MNRTITGLAALAFLSLSLSIEQQSLAEGVIYEEGVDQYISTKCTPPTHRAKDNEGVNKPITQAEMDRTEIVFSQNPSMSPETHKVLVMDIFCTNQFALDKLQSEGQWYKSARIRDVDGRWSVLQPEVVPFVYNKDPVAPPVETYPDISPDAWVVAYVSSEELVNWRMEGKYAFNRGNPAEHELWHSQYQGEDGVEALPPHEIRIDMGRTYKVDSFTQVPRESGGNAVAKDYSFLLSTDGVNYTQVAGGTFPPGSGPHQVTFPEREARYFMFVCLSEQDGGNQCAVDELYVTGTATGVIELMRPAAPVVTE